MHACDEMYEPLVSKSIDINDNRWYNPPCREHLTSIYKNFSLRSYKGHISMDIGVTLTKQRKAKKLHQSDVASLMTEKGFPVTNQAISKWENGTTIPNADQFLCLLDILGVDLVEFSPGLNAQGREELRRFIRILRGNPEYREDY